MNVDRNELFRLFGGLSDHTISDADHQRIEIILQESAEARRLWFLFNDIESGLAERPVSAAEVGPKPARSRGWWVAAVASAIGIAATLMLLVAPTRPPVATLSAATNASWSDPNVELAFQSGSWPAGVLRLNSGVAEVLFATGGIAVFEGPATFEILDANRVSLRSGRMICRCSTAASRITVITPNSQITDLSTEFGVSVKSDARTSVAVLQGKVRLETGGHSELLHAGQGRSIDRIGNVASDTEAFKEFATAAIVIPSSPAEVASGKNLLKDPGFETPPQEETETASSAAQPWRTVARCGDRVLNAGRDGTSAARVRTMGVQYAWIAQTVQAESIGGQRVIASVWAATPKDDPLRPEQCAIVKIFFKDRSGRDFARAERHFMLSGVRLEGYAFGSIAAIAPEGTAAIEYQVLLNGAGLKCGTLFFDDASLCVLPRGDANRP